MEMCGNRLLSNRRLELLQYWKTLTGAGYSPAATYWQMLKRVGISHDDDLESERTEPRSITPTEKPLLDSNRSIKVSIASSSVII